MANLLEPRWTSLDTHDLRLLLHERIGGPGQYDGDNLHLYIPLARDSCKLVLTYCGPEIVELSPGPRFSEEEWQRLVLDIDRLVQPEPHRVGRDFCFSTYRVTGSWHGARSGIHIHPPPPGTPETPHEMGDHPFVLEFPISWFGLYSIDNSRRIRTHRRLTLLLNLLLSGHTSFQSTRNQHLWAVAVDQVPSFEPKWVQASFFGPLGEIFLDAPSASSSIAMPELPADTYYTKMGHDGRSLMVPDDLDDSICRYLALSRGDRARLERSAYWLDLALRQWEISVSASYASLVSAIESHLPQGDKHSIYCPDCKQERVHDFPGSTAQFRDFFETYAPGTSHKARRNEMYSLRSKILHGSALMQVDQQTAFGWDPPTHNEQDLHNELWGLTRMALRNWLRSQPLVLTTHC